MNQSLSSLPLIVAFASSAKEDALPRAFARFELSAAWRSAGAAPSSATGWTDCSAQTQWKKVAVALSLFVLCQRLVYVAWIDPNRNVKKHLYY